MLMEKNITFTPIDNYTNIVRTIIGGSNVHSDY